MDTPPPVGLLMDHHDARLQLLSTNYHNALLYNVKLRNALKRILSETEFGEDARDIILGCKSIAVEALAKENAPPPPFTVPDGFYGLHPHPEYLHLPMCPTDAYQDPK